MGGNGSVVVKRELEKRVDYEYDGKKEERDRGARIPEIDGAGEIG